MRFVLWAWIALLAPGACAQSEPAETSLARARTFHRKGDYANAIPELRRALALRPGLVEAHGMLGEALLAQGFAAEALPHLERAGLVYLRALALLDMNRVPEAIQELLRVQARRPDDPDVLFHLGKAAGQLMQQSFNRLMRLHPGSARALELEGQNYLGQRRGDLAEPAFRKALKAQPRQPGIHLALGRILLDRGDLDAAEKELRAEAELSPGNAETAWRLGSVLLKKGRSREALIELQRSDRLKPGMLETLFDLGRAYATENQLEAAQKAFTQMIGIEDQSELAAAAHLQLSQILRRLGRETEAAQHLKRFRELNPPGAPKPQ